MKKFVPFAIFVAALIGLLVFCGIRDNVSRDTHMTAYTADAEIVAVIESEDIAEAVAKTDDGELFAFYANGFKVGDNVTLELDTNATPEIVTDDEITGVTPRL